MPPTDRELFEQALEALEDACGGRCNAENNPCWQRDVANALRERLAQSEQCQYPDCKCATENPCLKGLVQPQRTHWEGCDDVHPECKKPRREWVGLTDEEIMSLVPVDGHRPATTFARAIEDKLKEKNK